MSFSQCNLFEIRVAKANPFGFEALHIPHNVSKMQRESRPNIIAKKKKKNNVVFEYIRRYNSGLTLTKHLKFKGWLYSSGALIELICEAMQLQ